MSACNRKMEMPPAFPYEIIDTKAWQSGHDINATALRPDAGVQHESIHVAHLKRLRQPLRSLRAAGPLQRFADSTALKKSPISGCLTCTDTAKRSPLCGAFRVLCRQQVQTLSMLAVLRNSTWPDEPGLMNPN